SNPELLDLLANELAAARFDTRVLLREIALSRAYQRTSSLPAPTSVRVDNLSERIDRCRTASARCQAEAQAAQTAFQQALDKANKARAASAPKTAAEAKPAEAKKTVETRVAAKPSPPKAATPAVSPEQLAALEQA